MSVGNRKSTRGPKWWLSRSEKKIEDGFAKYNKEALLRGMPDVIPHQPPICNQFGCGKELTPTEYLYSEYCFKCQRSKNQNEII